MADMACIKEMKRKHKILNGANLLASYGRKNLVVRIIFSVSHPNMYLLIILRRSSRMVALRKSIISYFVIFLTFLLTTLLSNISLNKYVLSK